MTEQRISAPDAAKVGATDVRDAPSYDALLLVSFGGPEGPDEIIPFLEHVLRGRNVPRERMLEVAHHYELFGGVSPINEQNRALMAALTKSGLDLPVYLGNRNWRPFLADTLRAMRDDGRRHALAFITSAYSSYSSCRQYLEDIARAQEESGVGAPRVSPLRKFFDHPGFIAANADHLRTALAELPPGRMRRARVVFTAHSIPQSMARVSAYETQLRTACRLVADASGASDWELAYQSRSGSPAQPWLGPDIEERLEALCAEGVRDVVVAPIGFLSDHVEVLYDLDIAARALAERLGVTMVRAATVGVHPAFVRTIQDLVAERMPDAPAQDVCPVGCCPRGEERQGGAR
jgi:ferrochelatase